MKITQNYKLFEELLNTNGTSLEDLAAKLGVSTVSIPVYLWELKKHGINVIKTKLPNSKQKLYSIVGDDSVKELAEKFKFRKNAKQ